MKTKKELRAEFRSVIESILSRMYFSAPSVIKTHTKFLIENTKIQKNRLRRTGFLLTKIFEIGCLTVIHVR